MDFSLAAALDSKSKKPEGACKLGDPKHGPPKAHGEPGAAQKPRPCHGSSSDSSSSSSSSSDSDSEGKPHAAGSQQHKGTADKLKKPKMKKDKKGKDKKKGKKEAAH
ncbi:immortalization up-regulated protein [Heterocephalus glaber]|nr:immortalization up-regulated protein [Heterocephalus glaber]